MVLEDWIHFEPLLCSGVHSSASAGWLNDQQVPQCLQSAFFLLDTANEFLR